MKLHYRGLCPWATLLAPTKIAPLWCSSHAARLLHLLHQEPCCARWTAGFDEPASDS